MSSKSSSKTEFPPQGTLSQQKDKETSPNVQTAGNGPARRDLGKARQRKRKERRQVNGRQSKSRDKLAGTDDWDPAASARFWFRTRKKRQQLFERPSIEEVAYKLDEYFPALTSADEYSAFEASPPQMQLLSRGVEGNSVSAPVDATPETAQSELSSEGFIVPIRQLDLTKSVGSVFSKGEHPRMPGLIGIVPLKEEDDVTPGLRGVRRTTDRLPSSGRIEFVRRGSVSIPDVRALIVFQTDLSNKFNTYRNLS
ncbi:hypothetical protein HDU93_005367 [Gonapodya sp. JEL0774]|nr:hypothetical protein HDU93_005367 [Gonapodya sp. JEL0774]